VDAGRFVDEHIHGAWEVGDLPWSYAPPTAAFAVEEGTFPLVVAPGSYVGAPASAHVPGTAAQPVVARVTTDTTGARTRLRSDYLERIDTVYVSGTIGLGARRPIRPVHDRGCASTTSGAPTRGTSRAPSGWARRRIPRAWRSRGPRTSRRPPSARRSGGPGSPLVLSSSQSTARSRGCSRRARRRSSNTRRRR